MDIYLDKAIRPVVFIMSKMSGFIKTFNVKDGDKYKNNELMSFCIYNKKLLEKYKAIWTKIEELENNELNALPIYDDRYIKAKITTCGDALYTNLRCLNVPEDDIECEFFTVISIDTLLVYENKYYLHTYLCI